MWTGGGLSNLLLVGTKGVVSPGDGVNVLNVQGVRLQNLGITKCAQGVFVDSDQPGGISNVLIEHCIIYDNTGIGIRLEGGSQENFVRFNYLTGNTQYGIRVAGVGNTLLGNYVESMLLAGSGYRDGTAIYNEGRRTFIYQNEILNSKRDGIYNAGSHVTIANNPISDVNESNASDGSGIFIEGELTSVLVVANTIKDSNSKMRYGIYDASSTSGGVLIGGDNIVTGAVTAKMYSVNNVLADSIFLGNVGIGTVAPGTKLQVNGIVSIGASSDEFQLRSLAGYAKIQSYGGRVLSLNEEGNNVAIGGNSASYKLDVQGGDIATTTVGKGFRVKEGTNAKMGTATLSAGTVTVSTTAVTANSRIFLTAQNTGGTPGALRVSARSSGTSFTITSTSNTDTSTVAWFIVEPA
jgi:hypothetical protein